MQKIERTIPLSPVTQNIVRAKILQRNALNAQINELLEVAAQQSGVGDDEVFTTDDNVTQLLVLKKDDVEKAQKNRGRTEDECAEADQNN